MKSRATPCVFDLLYLNSSKWIRMKGCEIFGETKQRVGQRQETPTQVAYVIRDILETVITFLVSDRELRPNHLALLQSHRLFNKHVRESNVSTEHSHVRQNYISRLFLLILFHNIQSRIIRQQTNMYEDSFTVN
jgi:hypothetical protein